MLKGRVVGVEGNRKEPQLSAFISVTHATRNSLLLFPSRTLDVPVVQLMDNTIFSGKGLFSYPAIYTVAGFVHPLNNLFFFL